MKNSWKTIKQTKIHENPWYSLREDDVIRPDGNPGKYYVIDGVDSVDVIAEDGEELIYLVGQSRYPVGNEFSWEIITGGLKKGGDHLNTAKRELREETGLEAEEWQYLGFYYPIDGYGTEKSHIYLAKKLHHGENELEPTEDIVVRKETVETILEMIRKNEIYCGMTISAITKYLLYKGKL